MKNALFNPKSMPTYQVPLWFLVEAQDEEQAVELAQRSIETAISLLPQLTGLTGGLFFNEVLGDPSQVIEVK